VIVISIALLCNIRSGRLGLVAWLNEDGSFHMDFKEMDFELGRLERTQDRACSWASMLVCVTYRGCCMTTSTWLMSFDTPN
jgi:hypothetical protein